MRKLLLLIAAFLPAAAGLLAASEPARIDLIAFDRKTPLQLLEISEGGKADAFSWESDGGKWGLSVNLPAGREWKSGFVKIRPENDATLIISLMGPDVRDGDSPRRKVEMEYSGCAVNGKALLSGKKNIIAWHDKRHDLYAEVRKGQEYTITFTCRRYEEPVTIRAGREFRPVDMSDLAVKPGSALDLSSLFTPGAITEESRLTIREGRFVLASDPERRVRLTGCSVNFRGEFYPLDKDGIKAYVALAKRQGYNLFRAHYLDAYLMWGAKTDLEFVPEHLDKFHYWVSCMKEAGMYLSLDAMSAPSGYRKLKTDWSRHEGPAMSGGLFLDPALREEWKKGTARLLRSVNPYTGMRLLDDPVLVNIVPYNEQDHFFVLRNQQPFLPRFRKFLIDKYGSEQKVLEAYGPEFPAFDRIGIAVSAPGLAGEDSRNFVFSLYKEMNGFYVDAMREIGFKGYLSQLDCDSLMRYTVLRNDFPVISMHSYHAHPSNYIERGSQIEQTSSVQTRAAYLTGIGSVRFLDRPFMITEINHVFWNRFRYEQGLLGAYSAYQDYDCFIPHSGPVLFRGNERLNPFGVGADPICRASDVVTNFLMQGDVLKAAPRSVEFVMDSSGMVQDGRSESYMPDVVRASLLFTRAGIRFRDLTRPAGVEPLSEVDSVELDSREMNDSEYAAGIFRRLLDGRNPSRPAEGFFVADSGEITLDARKGYLQVCAPKLEGASSVVPMDFTLPHLRVKGSVPGSATLLALDGQPIAESSRMLLVIAGDALNDGMKFTDSSRSTLLELGKTPLLQTFQSTVAVRNRGKAFRAWSLRMNGERMDPIPVRSRDGAFILDIDTAALPGGPCVFFELEDSSGH